MKLIDMPFKKSRDIQMQIVPVIERIMSNEKTAQLFDDRYADNKGKDALVKMGIAQKNLVNNLLENHYEDICYILGLMNDMELEEIQNQSRGEANKQIADMFGDQDLASFFMSSETLGQQVQSVISEAVKSALQEQEISTSKQKRSTKSK